MDAGGKEDGHEVGEDGDELYNASGCMVSVCSTWEYGGSNRTTKMPRPILRTTRDDFRLFGPLSPDPL